MNPGQVVLLDGGNATGSWQKWLGGRAMLVVYGTFDSAVVRLEVSPNGGATAIEIDANRSAAYVGAVEIPYGFSVRAKVSSAGAGTVLTAILTSQVS